MAFQSPLIAIPKKTTQDVDWTGPIRTIIAQSYGEDPSVYTEECSVLQRCRQDAVRGAGSDQTARDLLYKYFGQLELLELRFAEIKVPFAWNDAFTEKLTTQTSLAFEKASIIHLISSVLSSLAQSPSRSDPEGLKRAYYNTRASAGMLTYINENFLHAPSTDLSREVVHLCIAIMTAQATEIFTEKLVEEKKSPALVSRSANSTAAFYNTALDEMKEFQGKGVFDRNWLYILQIKSKLFASLAQYYKAVADSAAGKHGPALVRFKMADTLAQEASRQSGTFAYTFVSTATPSLPHDAGTSLQEITKAHATVCAEAKDQATKDNDLIYHEVLPSEAALPAIEKLPAAAPITIQEVYGNPDVTKLIGPDIFIRLVPLAVHESASVYSEEKAKLVRAEVERVEISEGEIRAGLEHLGLPGLVSRWRKLAEDDEVDGEGEVEISSQVRRLAEEISQAGSIEHSLRQLDGDRERCERELRELSALLDNESRECERMRAKYAPQFTQSPSGSQTANFRSNIASNLSALSSASSSDANLQSILKSIHPNLGLLHSGVGAVENAAAQIAAGKASAPQLDRGVSLLDLDDDVGAKKGLDEKEKEELRKAVADASERLDRLGKIRRERDEVLKDLKEKIQNDDVSSLLLLNRRSSGVEPQLFAAELEKFRPYQGRLAAAVQASASLLQELEMLVLQVEKGKGVKELQRSNKDRLRRVRDWERKLIEAGEGYAEIQAGLSKGLTYYESLGRVLDELKREVKGFVNSRESERNRMVGEIETRQRLGGSPPPASSTTSGARSLEDRLAALSVAPSSSPSYSPMPAPPQPPRQHVTSSPLSGYPPPPAQVSTPSFPPPPPPVKPMNPYDLSSLSNLPSAFTSSAPPPTTHNTAQSHPQSTYGSSTYSYPSLPDQHSASPYPPPPTQPPRPSAQTYGSYGSPSQPAAYGGSYPAPLHSQTKYSSPPPSQPSYQPPQSQSQSQSQPIYGQQNYGQSSYTQQPSQQSYAAPSQGGSGYYPAPPNRPSYTSPPPPQQQQPQGQSQQYPNYPPPTGSYPSQPPPPLPPSQGQGPGQQGYGYGGYQYR
ncbi:vacuolar protein-sorting protein BRO1 [Kwoniella heveanensis CBS 569]|nr:vacuolar protein-sorting protein BRO1 [Kwoniella heveanensis CBS 569]